MPLSLTCAKCQFVWVSEHGRCRQCGHDVITVESDDDTQELHDD